VNIVLTALISLGGAVILAAGGILTTHIRTQSQERRDEATRKHAMKEREALRLRPIADEVNRRIGEAREAMRGDAYLAVLFRFTQLRDSYAPHLRGTAEDLSVALAIEKCQRLAREGKDAFDIQQRMLAERDRGAVDHAKTVAALRADLMTSLDELEVCVRERMAQVSGS